MIKKIIKKIKYKLLGNPKQKGNDNTDLRFMSKNPKYNKYNIGVGTYGFPEIFDWNDNTNLTIGNYCSIASKVMIFLGGEHHSNWVTMYPFQTLFKNKSKLGVDRKSKGDVVIGHDVWIGTGVLILSGVKIGNGVAIGAGSIVTGDLDDYGIYAGNPAKLIKYRFNKDEIEALNKISWWHWEEEKIKSQSELLMNNNIKDFIEAQTK
ncbi:antibiotic acetyltransferase [Flavobacteriaceae bacterium R38]|nr:antibiotic acetyltransferase [Flavobacteriaceae bacterium R38]